MASRGAVGPRHDVAARQASTTLLLVGLVLAVLPLLGVVAIESPIPERTRGLAALLWALCCAPALLYLSQAPERRSPIPFLPLIGVLFGLYYAVPIALGVHGQYGQIVLDPTADYDLPLELATLGWVAMLLSYCLAAAFLPISTVAVRYRWRLDVLRRGGFLLLFLGLGVDTLRQFVAVPRIVAGLFNFSSSLFYLGVGIMVLLLSAGQLSRAGRFVLGGAIAADALVRLVSGSMLALAHIPVVLCLSVWIVRRRLGWHWLFMGTAMLVLLVVVRGVQTEYRPIVWFTTERYSVAERAQILGGLVADRVRQDGALGAVQHGFEVVGTRSAAMDLFADVVSRTPEDVPYWNGTTYLSLVGIAVPRFLWPDKPTKQLGQEFGHRYGYLDPSDNSTAINLPFLVEFYVNFGAGAVVIGMALLGLVYRVLDRLLNSPGKNVLVSTGALVLLIPLLNIESDLSLTFGSVVLNGVALWLIVRFLERRTLIVREPIARVRFDRADIGTATPIHGGRTG